MIAWPSRRVARTVVVPLSGVLEGVAQQIAEHLAQLVLIRPQNERAIFHHGSQVDALVVVLRLGGGESSVDHVADEHGFERDGELILLGS